MKRLHETSRLTAELMAEGANARSTAWGVFSLRRSVGLAFIALSSAAALFVGSIVTFAESQPQPSARPAQEAAGLGSTHILYPPEGSVVLQERVQLIAVAKSGPVPGPVRCDGQPVPWEPMTFGEAWLAKGAKPSALALTNRLDTGPGLWLSEKAKQTLLLATLELKPGAHRVELDGANVRLFRSVSEGADAPAGWGIFRSHPAVTDTNRPIACVSCHDVQGGALGRAKVPDTCQTCHDAVDLRLSHSHVMDPLLNCLMCHDPHGTRQPSLLINTKAKLCTRCHEGGHTRS